MKTGLTVRQSVYVDDSQVSTHVVRHHFHQLMVLYPEQLDPAAIRVFFAHLPRDVTLISEANLQRLGPVDMVIAGWPFLWMPWALVLIPIGLGGFGPTSHIYPL